MGATVIEIGVYLLLYTWKTVQKILFKLIPQFGGYSHGTFIKLGKITEKKILKKKIVSFPQFGSYSHGTFLKLG